MFHKSPHALFLPENRRTSQRTNLGARMQIILTLTAFPPAFQSPSSHSPNTVSVKPSAIRRNSIGRHKNTSSIPSSASKTPSCFLKHTLHLRKAIPPRPSILCASPSSINKKAPQAFHLERFCRSNADYFMTFGKVSTLASETHWVTAASYAAFWASSSISS